MQTSPHKIEQSTVTADDIGSAVTYRPKHLMAFSENSSTGDKGVIKSWNDKFIFVTYDSTETTKATSPEDLVWG